MSRRTLRIPDSEEVVTSFDYIPRPPPQPPLPEWRPLDRVLADPAIALALDPEALENGRFPTFDLYPQGRGESFSVTFELSVGRALWLRRGSALDLDDDYPVRLFDPEEGCLLPWPEKPYPDVEVFVREYRARRVGRAIKGLEAEGARLEKEMAKIRARIAKLKNETGA